MNEPIAWLDGLIAVIVIPVGFLILAYVFRTNNGESKHQ
jgi:hypothetical protein